jgi:hypothetical protein
MNRRIADLTGVRWICTTAGSPGTWKTFANIAA